MDKNPYESPRAVAASVKNDASSISLVAERAVAVTRWTLTILVMAVPAIANLLLFNHFVTGQVTSQRLYAVLATLNAIGVALIIFGLLFGGMFVLEKLTYVANRMFGEARQLDRWMQSLYIVVGQAWAMAIPAATLWAIWLWMYYGTKVPYFIYGIPMLILAHLMAASLYG